MDWPLHRPPPLFPRSALSAALGLLAILMSPGYVEGVLFRGALLYEAGPATTGVLPGGAPFAAASRDLNGDSRPDLVIARSGSVVGSGFGNTVTVLLRSSTSIPPHFSPGSSYETDFGPEGVALADLNDDTHVDIVTANTAFGGGTVSILYGDGSGGFSAHVDYAAGSIRGPIQIADVNSDEWLDVVVALTGASFAVLRNDTGGGLLPPATFVNGAGDLKGLALGDVTGDGILDIVTANGASHSVSVLQGDGAGDFSSVVGVFATGTFPWAVAIGRLDADLNPDLAVAARGSAAVSVMINAGGGVYPAFVNHPTGQDAPWTLALEDLHGDGDLDIIAACNEGTATSVRTISYLKGTGDGGFSAAITYDGGPNPGQVVIADFDEDGHLDVAAPTRGDPLVNTGAHTVSLLLNDRAGNLLTTRHQPSASDPFFPATADFNCDGRLDVAVTVSTGIEIHLGNGDGSFVTLAGPAFPPSPRYLQGADVNRDGKPDLMVQSGSDITLCEGFGNGTFAPPVVKAPAHTLLPGSLADMNRDERLDLIAVDGAGQIRILLQDAIGNFIGTGGGAPAGGVLAFAVSDWNRDGRPDLAAATSAGLSVFAGNGDGTLIAGVTLGGGSVYGAVCAGDFDRNGRPDLAARESIPSTEVGVGGVDLFYGNGSGGFAPALPHATLDVAGSLVASRDLNRDGAPDLLASSGGSGDPPNGEPTSIGAFLGEGGLTFSQRTDFSVGAAELSGEMALGDFNGDRTDDLVGFGADLVPGPSLQHHLSILLATPKPKLASLESQVVYSMGAGPSRVALGDLDRDGTIDVLASSSADGGVTVRLGTGLGTLGPAQPLPQSLATRQIGLGDLNRDGMLDFASIGGSSPTRASIMLGKGDGTFGPRADFDAATNAMEFVIEDVNRDGKLDLVVSDDGGGGMIRVHPGAGNGTFGPAVSSPGSGYDIDLADLNCDGKVDIVGAAGSALFVMQGLGDGTFGPATAYPIGAGVGVNVVCVADFNRDGKLDAAAPSIGVIPGYIAVLLGTGAGGFSAQVNTTIATFPSEIEVGYPEADEDPFLYTTAPGGNQLVVFKSVGDGLFLPGTFHPTAAAPLGIGLGDLNRDALPDVVVANQSSDNVSVLLHGATVTSVEPAPAGGNAPSAPRLAQNHPNPFNPSTTIRFTLPEPERARITIFDASGREIATLVDRLFPAGDHRVEWQGRNDHGAPVASGVYFYRLRTSRGSTSRRMMVLR
jgi:FG-GAP-like repeat/FlgD Ig-like domain